MNNYSRLLILLPCHSLEDFPLHYEGEEAESLLANWVTMFHPALIHSAGAMPTWSRVDDLPEGLADQLLLVPQVSESEMPAGFAARAKDEGAVVIRGKTDLQEIISEALAHVEAEPVTHNAEVVADFLALGYCFLQVELLTRQMRYSSNLDEVYFGKQLVAAAAAAMSGDEVKTRELLQSCFDVLGEERDHFYPVDAYLIDLTLVAQTTLGEQLVQELQTGCCANLLISGQTLDTMATEQPQSLAALREAVQQQKASLVGGEYEEGPAALWDGEAMFAELQRGLAVYETHLGTRPHIFGRRRFGLSPWLPQVLTSLGFTSAIHATFDGGRFPDGGHTKTTWEGTDGSELPVLARPPLDASKPETFLNLCIKMGESMDSDHVATLYFAHWPGQVSPWYHTLRRIANWGSALGKFTTLENYFQIEDQAGLNDCFGADLYRSPYLKQDVTRELANPISSNVDFYRAKAARQAVAALDTLSTLLSSSTESLVTDDKKNPQYDNAAQRFSAAIPRSGSEQPGYLVANPHSFVRRVCLPAAQLKQLPTVEKPVYAVGRTGEQQHVVVDVPQMGFAWVASGDDGASKNQKPLVDEGVLRNEFFEIRFDETTGAMRSLHDYNNRGNRLSQQLALRMPAKQGAGAEGPSNAYSVMVCDSLDTTIADAAVGEISSRGRLVDREGKLLADFVQRYRAVRGSRVLQIDIELKPHALPQSDAWNSYYACRFAWADEAVNVYRSVGGGRVVTDANRFESPLLVELDLPKQNTAILTGGLPYHRRVGLRMLDTLLIVRGETAQKFTLGVGIDLRYPLQEAVGLLTPPTAHFNHAAPPAGSSSSWLFHIDSKNVIATHWEPLHEGDNVVGFRVRLLEAYDRPARVALSCFKNVAKARKINLQGEPQGDCEIDGDKVRLEMTARQWTQLEVRW